MTFSRAQPHLAVLPNGMQVLIQEDDRFPLVVMRLYVRAGSAYEQDSEAGISHVLEHMAFKGTEASGAGQAAQVIEGAGGSLNAATGFDQTVYMIDLPAEHWVLGIENLYQLCFGSVVNHAELELEKQVILAELEKNADNPRHRLFEEMQRLVWAKTPYGRPIIGSRETILALSPESIQAYVQRTYLPQSTLLVICGQVKVSQVLDTTRQLFGTVHTEQVLSLPPDLRSEDSRAQAQVSVYPTPWKKGYLAFAFPGPAFSALDSVHLELAAYILGGDTSSRWYAKYRFDQGLLDEFGVSPVLLERGGMIYVHLQLEPEQIKAFSREWLRDLQALQHTAVSKTELERARLNTEDAVLQARETLSGLASKLGHFQFFEKNTRAEELYLDQLRKASQEEVQAAMASYLVAARMHGVFLVPEKSAEDAKQSLEELTALPKAGPVQTRTRRREQGMHPSQDVIDLGQGCRLVLLPDNSLPYTALDITWTGGDQLLRKTEQGLAALTAKTLIKGAGKRDAEQIRELLSSRAGYLQGLANRNQFSVLAKFPSRFSPDLMELFQDIIQRPAFDPDELRLSARDQASRIIERCDHPLGRLSREVFPFLFPDHPYGYYHLGDPAGLETFQSRDLQHFWRLQTHNPWVLSVCGDFDPQEIEATARALLCERPEQPVHSSVPVWSKEKHLELKMQDRNQAHVLLVFPVPGLGSPLDPCTALAKKILAGQDGILFKELRDRQGLGYSVAPMLSSNPGVGFLGFYIGTYAEKVEQAINAFHKVISELQDQLIEPDRLQRARNMLQAEYYRERQGMLSRCSEATDVLTFGLQLQYYQEMVHKAQSIDSVQIRKFIRAHLQWESRYSIILRTEN